MARIRTIKPEFWSDEKMAQLDPLTRLVFLGLISQADDAGRLIDSVRLIDGLLFPFTDETCTHSLVALEDVGVIARGLTTGGQPVIQVVGWEAHQRVDKPNLKAALDPIDGRSEKRPRSVVESSTNRRGNIPDAVRQGIIERDGGVCQNCGVVVKHRKDDRYDSDPTLAEIDHIIAVADGGTDDLQNLQLLCLSCNRKKAGDAVRRRFADASTTSPRQVHDKSTPGSTTNDLRPTTYDLRPTICERVNAHTHEVDGDDELMGWLGEHAEHLDGCAILRDGGARKSLFVQFGPPAMRANAWMRPDGTHVPESERPRIFVAALLGYSGEGRTRVVVSEFAGLLRRAIRDESMKVDGSKDMSIWED